MKKSNKSYLIRVVIGIAAVAGGYSASATTITVDAVNSGWYTSSGAANGNLNNIFTGFLGATYRDWLGFNLSSISGTITGAILEVSSHYQNDSGQLVNWWDVTTPYSSLGVSSTSTFNDLGSGILFGQGTHTAGTLNSFSLNANALASLNAATSFWAIGGQNTVNNYAFGYTDGVSSGDTIRLVLTVSNNVPDGGFTLALLGMAMGGMVLARSQFRRNPSAA
jgi:hypothetical protein